MAKIIRFPVELRELQKETDALFVVPKWERDFEDALCHALIEQTDREMMALCEERK